MSFKEFQEDFNKTIRPQIEEILKLLKDRQDNDIIEVTAAKIIKELKTAIHDCPKETLKVLSLEQTKGKEIVIRRKENPEQKLYSYPNFCVGNEELGTGKNPNNMTWPFGSKSI